VLLAFSMGCEKKAQDASADAEAASAAAAAPATSSEVAPPPPVVSGDPDIPLNEAVVGPAPVPADYAADVAPPAAVTEEQPASPETGDVWVPGYWWWSVPFHRYVWVSGAWRNPPPDQAWTPGEWVSSTGGKYVWVPGFWAAHGTPRAAMLDLAPPPPRVEVYGAPPGVGYIWGPGYYAWRGDSYYWTEGSWMRPPHDGYGWVEPRYVNVGGRYSFQPGRWDFPAERRGTVYRPDINVHAGGRITPVVVPVAMVTAHVSFNVAAAHAISQGGTRTAGGGFVVRTGGNVGGGGPPHGGNPMAGGNEHGGNPPGGNEHGGNPPGGNEPHAGGTPPGGNEPHGGGEHGGGEHGGTPGGNEPHAGGTPPGGNEPHGATPRFEPRDTEPRGNLPPAGNPPHAGGTEKLEPKGGPSTVHGTPPNEHVGPAPSGKHGK